jgi:deazaflavin-dependent oxidoreductase (nitroreductase family)
MLRLRTLGRRTGEERKAVLAYLEDGSDLILMAMNGWADPVPAWWLNLQAHPEADVDLPGGSSRAVSARIADEDERPRLWAMWAALGGDLDAYAAGLSHEAPVIILEPRPGDQ